MYKLDVARRRKRASGSARPACRRRLFALLRLGGLRSLVLVSKVAVALMELLALLLEGLEIEVLLLELLLEGSHLGVSTLAGDGLVALESGQAVLEADVLGDEDVGAVEDQRQEEREAAEVHVALGVELAGLDFEAFMAEDRGTRSNTRVSY